MPMTVTGGAFAWRESSTDWVRDDGVRITETVTARTLHPGPADFTRDEVLALCAEFGAPVPVTALPPGCTYGVPLSGPTSRTMEQLRAIADRCVNRRRSVEERSGDSCPPDASFEASLVQLLKQHLRVQVRAGSSAVEVAVFYNDIELARDRAAF